jgi:hypothetical protein
VALGGQEFKASPIYWQAWQGKWGDWVGATHGRAEPGCIEPTRLLRTASWQWGKAAAANCAWSARRRYNSHGPCCCAGVRGDVATTLCNDGHEAEGARQVAAMKVAHTHAMGRLGARQVHVRQARQGGGGARTHYSRQAVAARYPDAARRQEGKAAEAFSER